MNKKAKDSGEEVSRETQALSGAFLKDADSQRFSVYNFTFIFVNFLFWTTYFLDDVTTMLSLMPLMSL